MNISFFLLVALCVTIAFVWYWFSEARVRRTLTAARRIDVQNIKEGDVVKVVGRVASIGPVLTAPLSDRPCVLYDVLVERSSRKGSPWVRLFRETKGTDFVLQDKTGRARVRTEIVRVAVEKDGMFDSGFLNDATPQLEALLKRHGQSSVAWVFNKRLRYREGILETGETVAALGRVTWEEDPDTTDAGSGYRDRPRRAVIGPPPGGAVIVSDDPAPQ